MKKINILILLYVILAGSVCSAQNSTDLTEEQKELLRQRVVQKVEEFGSSLSRMVDPEQSREVRTENQKKLLSLFIEKGQPYDMEDSGEIIHSDGVRMMTSSINRKIPTSSLLRNYVRRLYNPTTGRPGISYSKIKIETADAVRVDNIYKEGERYVCIAYFYQDFYGYRDGQIIYQDRTCKKIKCYITPMNIPDGVVFDAKLGDISVISTERI